MTYDDKLRIIGAKIVYYRKVKGYNQKDFADKLGVTRQYLGKVERGENNCSLALLNSIADALDVTLSNLVEGL